MISEAGPAWGTVDLRLRQGRGVRGVRAATSLADFLRKTRGRPPRLRNRPRLTVEAILGWADAHFQRHGDWPNANSGPIPGTDDTWCNVQAALVRGGRGLRGGSSLAQLLHEKRGKPCHGKRSPFSVKAILGWADVYFRRHGDWPTKDGPIPGTDTRPGWLSTPPVEGTARPARRLFIGSSAWEAAGANHACQAATVGRPRNPPLGRRPFQVARQLAGPAFGHDSRDAGHLVCRRTWPCRRSTRPARRFFARSIVGKGAGAIQLSESAPIFRGIDSSLRPAPTSKCMANGRRRLRVRSQGWRKHGAVCKSPCATDCAGLPGGSSPQLLRTHR